MTRIHVRQNYFIGDPVLAGDQDGKVIAAFFNKALNAIMYRVEHYCHTDRRTWEFDYLGSELTNNI